MLCFTQKAQAQLITRAPQFDQYFNNPIITNPSRVDESDGFRFNRRSLSGPFKNVTSLLGSYQHQLGQDSGRNEQRVTLMFINEKEGGFLNRTRIYGGYSWSTMLNSKWRFTGGSLVGLFNYFVKSSNTSAGGSGLAPDIQMGVWLNSKKTGVGIAMNQLLNNSMSPFGARIRLDRHYNLGLSHKIDLNSSYKLLLHSNSILSSFRNDHRVNTQLSHRSGLTIGTGGVYKRGIMIIAGLNNYQLSDKRFLDLGVSYFTPTGEYASQVSKVLEVSFSLK